MTLRTEADKNGVDDGIFPEKLLQVEDAIITAFAITRDLLRAETRAAEIVKARHMVWYIARDALGMTSTRIARLYGKDHTTILHGVERIERDGMVAEAYKLVADVRNGK